MQSDEDWKGSAMEILRYQINTESLVNNVVPRMSDQRRRAVNLLYTFDWDVDVKATSCALIQ